MNKSRVLSVSIVLILTLLMIFGGLSTASILAQELIEGNDPDLGLETLKIEDPESGSYNGITLDIYDTDDGQEFDWTSDRAIAYVFVKGGSGGNLYDYTPAAL